MYLPVRKTLKKFILCKNILFMALYQYKLRPKIFMISKLSSRNDEPEEPDQIPSDADLFKVFKTFKTTFLA